MSDEYISYMGHLWVLTEGTVVTIGLQEDALDEIESIQRINLPKEGEEVQADESCGDVDSPDGSLSLYSPISGNILEVNQDVIDNPDLIFEDATGEGWLLRVEASDESELESLFANNSNE